MDDQPQRCCDFISVLGRNPCLRVWKESVIFNLHATLIQFFFGFIFHFPDLQWSESENVRLLVGLLLTWRWSLRLELLQSTCGAPCRDCAPARAPLGTGGDAHGHFGVDAHHYVECLWQPLQRLASSALLCDHDRGHVDPLRTTKNEMSVSKVVSITVYSTGIPSQWRFLCLKNSYLQIKTNSRLLLKCTTTQTVVYLYTCLWRSLSLDTKWGGTNEYRQEYSTHLTEVHTMCAHLLE